MELEATIARVASIGSIDQGLGGFGEDDEGLVEVGYRGKVRSGVNYVFLSLHWLYFLTVQDLHLAER